MEKAKSGDKLQSVATADTWNAFVDAAHAHKQDSEIGGNVDKSNISTTVFTAVNASGSDCPWGGIVEIVTSTDQIVEFDQYGSSSGTGIFGVVQDKILAGQTGPVAIGGTFEIGFDGSVGDVVGVNENSFGPTNIDPDVEVAKIVQSPTGYGVSKAVFLDRENGVLLQAQEDMTADETTYTAKPILADGTLGDVMDVVRPPGMEVKSGQTGFLAVSGGGKNIFLPAGNEKVKVSETDTTSKFLFDAVKSSDSTISIEKTTTANEKLDFTVDPSALEMALNDLSDTSGINYYESYVLVAGSGDTYEEKQLSHTSLSETTSADHHERYTDEEAQDAAGSMASDGLDYDDQNNEMNVDISTSGIDLAPEIQVDANNNVEVRMKKVHLVFDGTSLALSAGSYGAWRGIAGNDCQA